VSLGKELSGLIVKKRGLYNIAKRTGEWDTCKKEIRTARFPGDFAPFTLSVR
jgi:hypothetical protein